MWWPNGVTEYIGRYWARCPWYLSRGSWLVAFTLLAALPDMGLMSVEFLEEFCFSLNVGAQGAFPKVEMVGVTASEASPELDRELALVSRGWVNGEGTVRGRCGGYQCTFGRWPGW